MVENRVLLGQLTEAQMKERTFPREEDVRGAYFRDTTALLHSLPFRRLKHKTQVFFSPKNDHICTRIEHVMHVASIASTIAKGLGLDSDLAWAIGLGHDLGHPPFGHTGEYIIQDLGYKWFHHELYALRILEFLAGHGEGLNLTYAVRDGIVSHCGESFTRTIPLDPYKGDLRALKELTHMPSTQEGAVVRFSDRISYVGRDLEDALSLGMISDKDIPSLVAERLGRTNREIINTLVQDLLETSPREGCIALSEPTFEAMQELVKFNYQSIYKSDVLEQSHESFRRILTALHSYLKDMHAYLMEHDQLPRLEKNELARRFAKYYHGMKEDYMRYDGKTDLMVLDYIAGMTDNFAIESAEEILFPKELMRDLERLSRMP